MASLANIVKIALSTFTAASVLCTARKQYLDVGNEQSLGVQALGVSVGLGVLEQIQEEHSALVGPATLGHLEVLALSLAADITLRMACGYT